MMVTELSLHLCIHILNYLRQDGDENDDDDKILFTGCEVCSVRLLHIKPDCKPRSFEGPLHLRPHLPHPQGWHDNHHVDDDDDDEEEEEVSRDPYTIIPILG